MEVSGIQEADGMSLSTSSPTMASLVEQVAERVEQSTHGRIRDLLVEEVKGQVVIRGWVPSHYSRQLALQGALELVPSGRCRTEIRVG